MTDKKDRKRLVVLIKKFDDYPDKEIYRGTLRKAKCLIPPSKKDQYKIVYLDEE